MIFARRRARKAFDGEMAAAVQAAQMRVEKAARNLEADYKGLRRRISELPGADPICPTCGGRLVMRRTKRGRNWWQLWICRNGHTATLSDLPRRKVGTDAGV